MIKISSVLISLQVSQPCKGFGSHTDPLQTRGDAAGRMLSEGDSLSSAFGPISLLLGGLGKKNPVPNGAGASPKACPYSKFSLQSTICSSRILMHVHPHVGHQGDLGPVAIPTLGAPVGSFSCVGPLVLQAFGAHSEALPTLMAPVGSLPGVDPIVNDKV